MRTLIERRPRIFSGGAAALMLTALAVSLTILVHPASSASAAPSVSTPAVSVVHGCDVGGSGDWVEATLRPAGQIVDPSNPQILQVGLAVTPNNSDTYPDGTGPVLVALANDHETVRLSGPIKGAHVFVRKYGSSSSTLATVAVPATCKHVPKTNLGHSDPEVIGTSNAATCLGSSAMLTVKIHNGATAAADYTVLLVSSDDSLVGTNPQGEFVHIAAGATTAVGLKQPYKPTVATYRFQARVLAQDGNGTDAGTRNVQCDSQGNGGQPSKPPVQPSGGGSPPPPARPTASAPNNKPVPRATPSVAVTSTPTRGGGTAVGESSGAGVPGASSSDAGGPVLGGADATSQPPQSMPSVISPHERILIGQAALSSAAASGFAIGGTLVLLVFAGAISGLVATNRASARRR